MAVPILTYGLADSSINSVSRTVLAAASENVWPLACVDYCFLKRPTGNDVFYVSPIFPWETCIAVGAYCFHQGATT